MADPVCSMVLTSTNDCAYPPFDRHVIRCSILNFGGKIGGFPCVEVGLPRPRVSAVCDHLKESNSLSGVPPGTKLSPAFQVQMGRQGLFSINDVTGEGSKTYNTRAEKGSFEAPAMEILFIDIASILWAVNISAVKDEAGVPIIPDTMETVNAGAIM